VPFAQDGPAPSDSGGLGNMLPFAFLLAMLAVMYFVMIVPQKREKNRWNEMVDRLKKNDRVLMNCGMIGWVHSVHKEQGEIVIKVDDATNTKLTFNIAAIARVIAEPSEEKK
jgi:preprotein translocase subunit YajC